MTDQMTRLKQEQPKPTCKTCGFYENNCPFIRGKLIPYPNKVCKDYIHSAMKEQEHPEVDLDKEIEMYISSKGVRDYAFLVPSIAHYFYELGLNARKEK